MVTFRGQEPGGREPAPEPLRLVQEFINTVNLEGGQEDLKNPEFLRAWLVTKGLMDASAGVSDQEFEAALRLREALRALCRAHHDLTAPAGRDLAALNDLAAAGRLRVRFVGEEVALDSAASDFRGAVDRLLAIVYRASVDGTWARLKACGRDVCRWAFYDHSKNRSGRWCTMSICGTRTHSRAYRRRRAGAPNS